MSRIPPPPDLRVGPAEEILDEHVVKLLARHEEMDPEAFWAEVESHIGHLVTTTWSSVGALVEMSAHGVSKASTLELVCRDRGIERRAGEGDPVLQAGDKMGGRRQRDPGCVGQPRGRRQEAQVPAWGYLRQVRMSASGTNASRVNR